MWVLRDRSVQVPEAAGLWTESPPPPRPPPGGSHSSENQSRDSVCSSFGSSSSWPECLLAESHLYQADPPPEMVPI